MIFSISLASVIRVPGWEILVAFLTILAGSIAFVATIYRYKKPKADEALIRTGGRKAKVSIHAGMWINTIIHEIKVIPLNSLQVRLSCKGRDGFITQDNFRVGMEVDFFIRVDTTEEGVLQAAHSFRDMRLNAKELEALVRSKLLDATRSFIAKLSLQELPSRRYEMADAIQKSCGKNLLEENGLIIESISIVSLDQVPLEEQLGPIEQLTKRIEALEAEVETLKAKGI